MTKFEEEFNYLIELSGKVLIGQVGAEVFEKNRVSFFEKYETDQQQALPVVPECVGEWIEHCKGMGYGLIAALTFKLSSTMHEELSAKILKWLGNEGNDETFALAFITGKYEVEKPQLFYLREKNTNYYLNKSKNNGLELVPNPYFDEDNQFTKQEIDSMQTGSYEQIEVEK
ncbi:DUF1642 domain-containing protein [Lactococcus lactis]|uniref:DUF1642 domain-containing protein n=1 Tax=Lactococcus lactis TaxID=1358 RepID=UPI002FE47BC4